MIEHFPRGILWHISDYLPPSDVNDFSLTCRKLDSQLSLAAMDTRVILYQFVRSARGDVPHYGFQIPMISSSSVHTVALFLELVDFGSGVSVVAEENGREYDRSSQGPEFGGGRVVFSSFAGLPNETWMKDGMVDDRIQTKIQ
ncbi:hypothetical protein ACHAWF_016103 [Thalassiosira exigua]